MLLFLSQVVALNLGQETKMAKFVINVLMQENQKNRL